MFSCFDVSFDVSKFITPVGWLVSSILGFYGATLLDNRRARRAVVGAIAEVLDELDSSKDVESTHAKSVDFLKPKIFGALTLLRERNQEKASNAWKAYRTLNFEEFPKLLFIQKVFSKPSPKEGMSMALQALMDAFK